MIIVFSLHFSLFSSYTSFPLSLSSLYTHTRSLSLSLISHLYYEQGAHYATPPMTTRTRTRRLSACYIHPSQPITGFCALCLRERLAGLEPEIETETKPKPEQLRRCKSVTGFKFDPSSSNSEPRRNSCDVKVRGTLSNLFNLDNVVDSRDLKVESRNLSEIRVCEDVVLEGDLKTMKEHIDLELMNKKEPLKDLRDIAGNLASVFTKKLRKWKQKQQVKKRNDFDGVTESEVGEYKLGRRSCDVEPSRMSVEGSRISFDEPPRASWDGYLIARTIPRLTPMLSVVEDVMLSNVEDNRGEDEHLGSIIEDETSSGGSGSGQTNSDSSSSQRRSSFDRSSSVRSFNKKGMNVESDEVDKDSPAKLVITEKELKDWRLSTLRDEQSHRVESVRQNVRPVQTGSTPNRAIKSSRWRKVCSKFSSFASTQNPVDDVSEKGRNEDFAAKFSRSSSCVGSRNSLPETNTKTVSETSGFKNPGFPHTENGLLRLYLTPFKSYRRTKSGKPKSQESNLMSRNAVRLN